MIVRGTPILTGDLFRPLTGELVALLRRLSKADWTAPTSAPGWSISDVCAHMLDGDLRRLSVVRDDHALPAPDSDLSDYTNLLAYLNQLNAEWVSAARRLSPRVITDLLETVGREVADLMERSDPLSVALYPVAWAGEVRSAMWLDVGREYTERWHHQDQIREAAGASPLRQPHWLRPVIEISLMALPHAYRTTTAPDGTRITLEVRGDAGGDWYLEHSGGWRLCRGRPDHSDCTIGVEDLALARLLLHRLSPDASRRAIEVTGESDLASPIVAARAVMV